MMRAVRPLLFCVVTALGGVLACVLVDPIPEIPKPVNRAPQIVTNGLIPPAPELTELPLEFIIPVRVPDPTQSIHYAMFVTPRQQTRGRFLIESKEIPGSTSARDLIDIRISLADLQPDKDNGLEARRCHTFEFIVTLAFSDITKTAPPQLSDSQTWVYRPEGACPTLFDASAVDDAGPDGGFEGGLTPQ